MFRSQETPNIPQKNKKINKAYFCIIILKKIFESVIWPETMTVLCNAVKIIFFSTISKQNTQNVGRKYRATMSDYADKN